MERVLRGKVFSLKVKDVLDKSEFYTTDKSVSIMDGRDEGIFSWFTVNYLFGKETLNLSLSFVLVFILLWKRRKICRFVFLKQFFF